MDKKWEMCNQDEMKKNDTAQEVGVGDVAVSR